MPSYVIREGKKIIDPETGIAYEYQGDNDNNYLIVLKGAHCGGNKYFIPIMKAVQAKDAESAVFFAKKTARVARHKKDCVLGVMRITMLESALIHDINERDPYFRAENRELENDEETLRRRIVDNAFYKEGDEIKEATEYDEDCVLQRYFAPIKYGKKYVWPKSMNLRHVLDEFLYYGTQKYGIERGYFTLPCLYYQQYGENNMLGIKYKDGILGYKKGEEKITIKLPPSHRAYMDAYVEQEKKQKEARERLRRELEERDKTIKLNLPSKVDRFKSRLAKTAEIQRKSNESPDEIGG